MPDYLQLLKDNRMMLGDWDPEKVSNLTPEWFYKRWIDLLDFRGDLHISAHNVVLGRKVTIITASHDISTGNPSAGAILKKVHIDNDVYIGSRAILYNCHVMHNSVVACGAVVRNMDVPPFTIVEGNPAKIVKEFKDGEWRKV